MPFVISLAIFDCRNIATSVLQIVLNQLDLERSWTFTFSSLYVGYSVASRVQYNTDSVCALQQGILKKKDGEGEHHCMIQERQPMSSSYQVTLGRIVSRGRKVK